MSRSQNSLAPKAPRPISRRPVSARCVLVGGLFLTLTALAIAAEPLPNPPALPAAADRLEVVASEPTVAGGATATTASVPTNPMFEQALAALDGFSPRLLGEFYADRAGRLAWTRAQARAMLTLAEDSVEHGLEPSDFGADALRALVTDPVLDESDPTSLARWQADLQLSDALLRYLHHLQYGRHNPRQINPSWTFVDSIEATELRQEMQTVLAAEDLGPAVAGLLPQAPFYEQLKLGYARYRALARAASEQGGWKPIPTGVNLTIGMRDPRVAAIRQRLALMDGYRFEDVQEPDIYDRALYDAVLAFQTRSGLMRDGVIGPQTLRALNHPVEERLASIRANLERMRWLYHELPSDYLFVDITAFQLELVRDHEPVWSTRTVVGTGKNQTPMFRDELEHLVFNPTWSVPQSIQKTMRGVPGDYRVIDRRTGRRVYPSNPTDHRRYRLVQQPGPRNALGRVKFMFPNGHAIYLHDTPSRHLFARNKRSYSHGCVRVENPLDLASELLAGQDWSRSSIDRVLARGRTRYVHLDRHLPVLLYYLTARADEQGRVGFRNDLYGRDARLVAAMQSQPEDPARIVFLEPEEALEPAVAGPADETAGSEPGRPSAQAATELGAAPDAAAQDDPNDVSDGARLAADDAGAKPASEEPPALPTRTPPAGSTARPTETPESASSQPASTLPWWGLALTPLAKPSTGQGTYRPVLPATEPEARRSAGLVGGVDAVAATQRAASFDLRPVSLINQAVD